MDVIVAAALIAVGIVGAAAVYARVTRGAWPTAHVGVPATGSTVVEATVTAAAPLAPPPAGRNGGGRAHSEELVLREQALRTREVEISERSSLLEGHQQEQLVLELERISGMSAARAKQLLIEQMEDAARRDAAKRVRQIEDDARQEAARRVRQIEDGHEARCRAPGPEHPGRRDAAPCGRARGRDDGLRRAALIR